ncbi:MAG TPA: hypothetical protein VHQ70_09035 [Syntrophomonadaceae bacterium]|nr:hypothetical protein [Syntrophomonadaceae bacterium]
MGRRGIGHIKKIESGEKYQREEVNQNSIWIKFVLFLYKLCI